MLVQKEEFMEVLKEFADGFQDDGVESTVRMNLIEVEMREMVQRHGMNMGEIIIVLSRLLHRAISVA